MSWNYGRVDPPHWNDRPVYLLGGGASLGDLDFSRLGRVNGTIVGVNQAMFDSPAAAGISIDFKFIDQRRQQLNEFAKRTPLYLAVCAYRSDRATGIEDAIYLKNRDAIGLSLDDDAVCGLTSGYAALNLAVLKQAKKIVLLGFDYGVTNGRHHYHDGYPWHHIAEDQSWAYWAKAFDAAKPQLDALGITVINASPDSAITCFAKMSIDEALAS